MDNKYFSEEFNNEYSSRHKQIDDIFSKQKNNEETIKNNVSEKNNKIDADTLSKVNSINDKLGAGLKKYQDGIDKAQKSIDENNARIDKVIEEQKSKMAKNKNDGPTKSEEIAEQKAILKELGNKLKESSKEQKNIYLKAVSDNAHDFKSTQDNLKEDAQNLDENYKDDKNKILNEIKKLKAKYTEDVENEEIRYKEDVKNSASQVKKNEASFADQLRDYVNKYMEQMQKLNAIIDNKNSDKSVVKEAKQRKTKLEKEYNDYQKRVSDRLTSVPQSNPQNDEKKVEHDKTLADLKDQYVQNVVSKKMELAKLDADYDYQKFEIQIKLSNDILLQNIEQAKIEGQYKVNLVLEEEKIKRQELETNNKIDLINKKIEMDKQASNYDCQGLLVNEEINRLESNVLHNIDKRTYELQKEILEKKSMMDIKLLNAKASYDKKINDLEIQKTVLNSKKNNLTVFSKIAYDDELAVAEFKNVKYDKTCEELLNAINSKHEILKAKYDALLNNQIKEHEANIEIIKSTYQKQTEFVNENMALLAKYDEAAAKSLEQYLEKIMENYDKAIKDENYANESIVLVYKQKIKEEASQYEEDVKKATSLDKFILNKFDAAKDIAKEKYEVASNDDSTVVEIFDGIVNKMLEEYKAEYDEIVTSIKNEFNGDIEKLSANLDTVENDLENEKNAKVIEISNNDDVAAKKALLEKEYEDYAKSLDDSIDDRLQEVIQRRRQAEADMNSEIENRKAEIANEKNDNDAKLLAKKSDYDRITQEIEKRLEKEYRYFVKSANLNKDSWWQEEVK